MRKIISIILLLTFALTFVSCSEAEEIVPEYIPMGDEVDFGGTEFTYLTEEQEAFIGVKEGTYVYDCVMERIDAIEQKLNCVLNIEHAPSVDSHAGSCRAIISAGLYPADIMDFRSSNNTAVLAYAGFLYPLTDVSDIINYEDTFKYGSPSVLECAMLNGVPYAVQPASWPGFPDSQCFFISYNRDKISSEGLTDPHEFYESKTWTWDTFETVLRDYTSTDSSDSYIALAGNSRAFSQLALFSNGVKYADYIDGVLKTDIYESKVVTAINWIQKIFNDYSDCIKKDVDYWNVGEFIAGQSMMSFVSGAMAYNSDLQYNCDFVFGLMPFPCGPDAVYGEWANWREELYGVCMPVTTPEPTASAHIISELCEPLEEFGTNLDDLKAYYSDYVFSSKLDTDIYFEVGNYGRYIYWQVGGVELAGAIADEYSSKSAQQLIDMYGAEMESMIEKYISPNFENYMYEHLYKNK